MAKHKSNPILEKIRRREQLSFREQLLLTLQLSVPAILTQISMVAMQYIDTAMVGSLGGRATAAVGLMASTTWLFGSINWAVATGFSVQVAHAIGANDLCSARNIFRQAISACLIFSTLMSLLAIAISWDLPYWLRGNDSIYNEAHIYFLIFGIGMVPLQFQVLSGNMLRSSGNIRIPSIINVVMCVLDVVFNFLMIFPTREVKLGSLQVSVPGAGLGVEGAAWGTFLATVVAGMLMFWYATKRSPELRLDQDSGSFIPTKKVLNRALKIGLPMCLQSTLMNSAQIMQTRIVAPLGNTAIAANTLAIASESLCYMPGFGIGDAATTLVGQSYGSGDRVLCKRFAYLTVTLGMIVMGFMGLIMYLGAPAMMAVMTNEPAVSALGVEILRIEAIAEPLFGAAIVTYGVCVGAGDTLIPCIINFVSMWFIRLTLAFYLAQNMGLKGVWTAMCIELCCRGLAFLYRLQSGKWMNHGATAQTDSN